MNTLVKRRRILMVILALAVFSGAVVYLLKTGGGNQEISTTQVSTSFNDNIPITSKNQHGIAGWNVYSNTKHQYQIYYPKQIELSYDNISDQSQVHPADESDGKQRDAIVLHQDGVGDRSINVRVEAWGPNTVYGYIKEPTSSLDLRTFAQKVSELQAGFDGGDSLQKLKTTFKETIFAGSQAYEASWGSGSGNVTVVYLQKNETKFIITYNSDQIAKQIASSFSFAD